MNVCQTTNFVDAIPEPEVIRRRLEDNRTERQFLKQLLRLAVQRAKARATSVEHRESHS
jgi:hypothetical protein